MSRFSAKWKFAAAVVVIPQLALWLAGYGVLGQSDGRSAVERVRQGDYAAATADLERAVEGGDLSAPVVESLYHSWVRRGEYEEAERRFEAWAAEHGGSAPIRLAAARVQRLLGNYERALAHLDAVADAPAAAVRYERAALLDELGRTEESAPIYDALIASFQRGDIAGGDLLYVARALWAREYFHDANDLMGVVTRADPRHAEAFAAWGDLLAEKYNAAEAVASYVDALAIDPNLPEALVGVARAVGFENPERSFGSIQSALAVNPRLVEAHLFLAERSIDSEQYDDAEEQIARALEVNPRSVAALSLMAATDFLRGDLAASERHRQQVLEINPRYSALYYQLAEACVSVRLYKEAVEFAREAVRLNPRDWDAHSLLGINLLRIGEEEAGKASLETAYEGDSFNVWTVNTLTLLDSFTNFDRLESEHFQIKLHRDERAALEPYVKDLLEKAYLTLSAKYRFTPQAPVVFEMFPDHDDFAVRTLGMPGLGALGVSFGRVVVMDSPSARPPESFNWGSTLWHEFAHVITLEATEHKIPRWFSEGLSVYEEREAVPGWGDDLQMDYLTAFRDGEFLPVAELNNGFVRPDGPEQVFRSYYQASLVCDYIEELHGFEAMLEMLELYRQGRDTPEVFQTALGVSLEEFDQGFTAWLDARTRDIDLDRFRELVRSGREALAAGQTDEAIARLGEAVALYPQYSGEQNPYEPLAEAYIARGDQAAAIETLDQFASFSEVAYGTYLKLAGLKEAAGDLPGAADVLQRAMYIHPMDLEGHRAFGRVLLASRRYDEAAREYQALIALGAPDLADAYFNLASAQYGAGDPAAARRSILRCLEIAPSYEAAQELLLRIVRN